MRVKDPWSSLRKDMCFCSVEPNIEITSITTPIEPAMYSSESLPALAAATSYGTTIDDIIKARSLNKKLIEMGHHTPLEAIQYNFYISNISKACGTQLSRHRIGQGHISSSRRYKKQGEAFIYPVLNHLEDEVSVKHIYGNMSTHCKLSLAYYDLILGSGGKKQDARLIMPYNTACERRMWINARALRDMFRLRLDASAEWEIRRLCFLMLDIVYAIHPSLFQDIHDKYND